MNDFGPMFWGKESSARLWHAIQEGKGSAICGKAIPTPRLTQKEIVPEDDVRCARCDRLVFPEGKG
jgi:hypothetical protein